MAHYLTGIEEGEISLLNSQFVIALFGVANDLLQRYKRTPTTALEFSISCFLSPGSYHIRNRNRDSFVTKPASAIFFLPSSTFLCLSRYYREAE
jgi:hypothetical protein